MAKEKDIPVKRSSAAVPARFDEMNRLFDDFLAGRWLRPFQWPRGEGLDATTPAMDVVDRENDVVVRAELPGFGRDDIEVSVSGNTITVKGSTRKEEEKEEGDYHRREIVKNAISRTVTLPSEVDGDKARAQLKDGVLEVSMPKLEQARRKRIHVEA